MFAFLSTCLLGQRGRLAALMLACSGLPAWAQDTPELLAPPPPRTIKFSAPPAPAATARPANASSAPRTPVQALPKTAAQPPVLVRPKAASPHAARPADAQSAAPRRAANLAPPTTPATASANHAPATPEAGSKTPEPAITRSRVDDASVRIQEVRVGGQTQEITVVPKSQNLRAYQVEPQSNAGDLSKGNLPKTGRTTRTWKLFNF